MASTPPGSSRFSSRVNSLGLAASALDTVLDALDQKTVAASRRRSFVRWPFRKESVQLALIRKGQPDQLLALACRNISSQGISLLHCAYLQPGCLCGVLLPGKEKRVVSGKVVRCEHRTGMMHEIGIQFSEPIDLREFAPITLQLKPSTLERVDANSLRGVLVHYCESRDERTAMRERFRATPLLLRSVADETALVNQVTLGCDAVLLDASRDRVKELVKLVRREAHIAIGGVALTNVEARMLQLSVGGLAGVVVRPFTAETMTRFVAELLHTNRVAFKSSSAKKNADTIRAQRGELEKAVVAGDARKCEMLCQAIETAATEAGFDDIGFAAAHAKAHLHRAGPLSKEQLAVIAAALISQLNTGEKWHAA